MELNFFPQQPESCETNALQSERKFLLTFPIQLLAWNDKKKNGAVQNGLTDMLVSNA